MLSGHTSPVPIPVSSATRSREERPRPEPLDPAQDRGEQHPWHRHLGQLGHDMATMMYDSSADLGRLLAQRGGSPYGLNSDTNVLERIILGRTS